MTLHCCVATSILTSHRCRPARRCRTSACTSARRHVRRWRWRERAAARATHSACRSRSAEGHKNTNSCWNYICTCICPPATCYVYKYCKYALALYINKNTYLCFGNARVYLLTEAEARAFLEQAVTLVNNQPLNTVNPNCVVHVYKIVNHKLCGTNGQLRSNKSRITVTLHLLTYSS